MDQMEFRKKSIKGDMKQVKMILGVMAGKGGVGKSALSVLLAHAIMRQGFKVGILDADLYGPSIANMMGAPPPVIDKERFLPSVAHGIELISMAFFNKKSAAFVRAPIANQMILNFIELVNWGELDLLIIDFPPGTGDIQLTLMQHLSLQGAILVTTPTLVAASDVMLAGEMARHMGVELWGVVENMGTIYHAEIARSFPLFEGNAARDIALHFDIPILEKLPLDQRVSLLLDEGKDPFAINSPLIDKVEKLALSVTSTYFARSL